MERPIKLTRGMFSGGNLKHLEDILLGLAADNAMTLYAHSADPRSMTVSFEGAPPGGGLLSTVPLPREVRGGQAGADPNDVTQALGVIRVGVEELAVCVNTLNDIVRFGGVDSAETLRGGVVAAPGGIGECPSGAEHVRTRRAILEADANVALVGAAINRAMFAFGQPAVPLPGGRSTNRHMMWGEVVPEAGTEQRAMPASMAEEALRAVYVNLCVLATKWNHTFGVSSDVRSVSFSGPTPLGGDGVPRVSPPAPSRDGPPAPRGLVESALDNLDGLLLRVGGLVNQRASELGLTPIKGMIEPEGPTMDLTPPALVESGPTDYEPLPVGVRCRGMDFDVHTLGQLANSALALCDQEPVLVASPGPAAEDHYVPDRDDMRRYYEESAHRLYLLAVAAVRARRSKDDGGFLSVVAAASPLSR